MEIKDGWLTFAESDVASTSYNIFIICENAYSFDCSYSYFWHVYQKPHALLCILYMYAHVNDMAVSAV